MVRIVNKPSAPGGARTPRGPDTVVGLAIGVMLTLTLGVDAEDEVVVIGHTCVHVDEVGGTRIIPPAEPADPVPWGNGQ